MANECTFLAWLRTSLGIMGFEILIERVLAAGAGDKGLPNGKPVDEWGIRED